MSLIDVFMRTPALLLIDMQEHYVANLRKRDKSRIISAQKEVIRFFTKKSWPVIALEHSLYGSTIKELREIGCFDSEKDPWQNLTTIRKPHYSGFMDTNLDRELKKRKVRDLVFAGIYTSRCVLGTAQHASERGYNIWTSMDLMANDIEFDGFPFPSLWYKTHGVFERNYIDLIDRVATLSERRAI